ncbi:MAG: hypothetical protein U1F43_01255 [Myxococcota bacterium]
MVLHLLGPGLAGHRLVDERQQREVGVAVDGLGERRRAEGGHGQRALDERLRRPAPADVGQAEVGHEVGDAGGVVQQHAHGDGMGAGEVEPAIERVVERELAGLDELHGEDGGVELGDAADDLLGGGVVIGRVVVRVGVARVGAEQAAVLEADGEATPRKSWSPLTWLWAKTSRAAWMMCAVSPGASPSPQPDAATRGTATSAAAKAGTAAGTSDRKER